MLHLCVCLFTVADLCGQKKRKIRFLTLFGSWSLKTIYHTQHEQSVIDQKAGENVREQTPERNPFKGLHSVVWVHRVDLFKGQPSFEQEQKISCFVESSLYLNSYNNLNKSWSKSEQMMFFVEQFSLRRVIFHYWVADSPNKAMHKSEIIRQAFKTTTLFLQFYGKETCISVSQLSVCHL